MVNQTNVPQNQLNSPPSSQIDNSNPVYKINLEKIQSEKYDSFFDKVLENGNLPSFRKFLMLDEAPNYFNPFIPNIYNNNVNQNPFYTNDPNKLSLNMNKYLYMKFCNINIKEGLKFLSNQEKKKLYFTSLIKIMILITFPFSLFYYVRTKATRYLFIGFFNSMLMPYTMYMDKIILYNSYLRNFNGYNDEQVDYILMCNSKKI